MANAPPRAPLSRRPLSRRPLSRRPLSRDWRVWLGLAITALAIWLSVRGISLGEVAAAAAKASWLPLLAIAVVHLIGLWVRALRWRYLLVHVADAPVSMAALFRATAVGFLAINVLPFRLGEFARPWFLSRETGVRGSAALGTLVLERAIDFTTLAAVGGAVVFASEQTLPLWVRNAALLFAAIACLPLTLALLLRKREALVARLAGFAFRPLPAGLSERLLDVVAQMVRGLTALRGARDVGAVFLCSVLLWGVVFAMPYPLGFLAFGLKLGFPRVILATYTAHALVSLAAAAPSAPGFFGVFHFACREALGFFGVEPATALAYGTLLHLAYWVPVTLTGLLCALGSGARLADLAAPSAR